MDEKEIYEICMSVDSIIADKLTESIIIGTSYDMLEAHYGILPISRRSFYRRKGTAQRLMRQRMAHLVEEKNGQYGLGYRATEFLMQRIGRGRDRQWHNVHFHCA